jgi:DNA-binding CsgD family transcriptional regulator/tetratricopeptide (TPR) repeat protein
MRPAALPATLSGRAGERARLLDVVRAGLEGSPRAVLVHGEAGIGKTTLVRSVCEEIRGEGAQALWGQSLRFGAVEAMYHPLVLALEGWLGEADDAERASVIEAVPGAALILPSLGASPTQGHSMLMMVVDALLSRVIARGPTVLVVDDVQWADPATWDALSYLVAGFGHQRLALLTTHRDEATFNEHFQHWLGNLRRLPGTEELVLTRLDEDATTDQITELLGRPPAPRLVDQVYERSRGNPYFSELLVRRGDLDSSELPDDLPDELSHALLDAWRCMSAPAREITRILAIAGRPTHLRTLAAIAAELGVSQTGSVREAVDAGVIVLDGDGAWFRHPLLAGVLAETYLPGEATPAHVAWAAHLESVSTEGVDELRRLGDIASHREIAGEVAVAFGVLLQGADLAEQLGARREAAEWLARAADLWNVGADPSDSGGRARLLERAGHAWERVGRSYDGYRLYCSARELVSPERDPLWASRLTVLVAKGAFDCGEIRDPPFAEMERAVELSRVEPDSREHANALAAYADVLHWAQRIDEARRVVDEAIAAAERSGSAVAVSWAYGTRAELWWETDLHQAEVDAIVCWEQAHISGDPFAIGDAHSMRYGLSSASGDLRRAHEHARDMYAVWVPYGLTVVASVALAQVLLAMGELAEAEGILRAGLAATASRNKEAAIRLLAGVLAARRGENEASRGHVTRAREVRPYLEERPECEAGEPMAEMLLAENDAAGAFEFIERVLPWNRADPHVLDGLVMLGARAAADLVRQASDDRDQVAVQAHREALTRLIKTRAALPGIAFEPSGTDDTVQPARAALFAAESGRAEAVEDQVGLWREAVSACAEAGLGWEQQVSSWRLASALVESGSSGTEAAALLRGIHDYAVQQRAAPLQTRVEELAASARISLTSPRIPTAAAVPAAFTGLTGRETEVLTHLVANRTNAEIAEALFISEKTVSVHVSNLLRKTETGSRREVAALARRVGWGHDG